MTTTAALLPSARLRLPSTTSRLPAASAASPSARSTRAAPVSLTAHPTDAGTADTFTYSWSVTKGGQAFALPNGAVTNASTFSFVPTDNGNYVVTVRITDDDGAHVDVATNAITVDNVNPTATISGEPEATIDEGDSVTLTAHPADDGSADTFTYSWSVTKDNAPYALPGNPATNAATFTFIADDQGTYQATCIVSDDDGGSVSVDSATIDVRNVAPTIHITGVPQTADEGDTISLGSTVTDPGVHDTFLGYNWMVFKDGQEFSLPQFTDTSSDTFSFVPTDNGTYVVVLQAEDSDGAQSTVNSSNIAVANVNPTAVVSGEPVGAINEGAAVHLTATPSDAGSADTFTYSWSVKKDNVAYTLPNGTNTTGANFTFTPRDNGTYIATIVIHDDDGGSVTVSSQTVTANNVNPTATITGEPVGTIHEGASVTVTAHPSDAGVDDTFTYSWSVTKGGQAFALPNGTTTNAAALTFTPTDEGNYVATCVVSDDDGGSVTVNSVAIVADNVAPTGNITGTPNSSPEGTSITVTAHGSDAGAADVLSYSWAVTKGGQAFALPNGTVTNAAAFTFTPDRQRQLCRHGDDQRRRRRLRRCAHCRNHGHQRGTDRDDHRRAGHGDRRRHGRQSRQHFQRCRRARYAELCVERDQERQRIHAAQRNRHQHLDLRVHAQ